MPKISVLMPVYKTPEPYLREAIESILQQTYTDFEFLILDDCPEDNRKDIVLSYHDKRIKYAMNEKNLGISESRNKLIDMAKGEYLAVFDHDDISLPERLEKEVKYLDEHPEIGVLSCQIQCHPQGNISKQFIEDRDIKLALITQCAVNHPAAMLRKSVLIDHNIRYRKECTPAEDYALWCSLVPYTQFHNLPEVLFKWRKHQSNTSKLYNRQMNDIKLRLYSEMKYNYPDLYDEFMLKSFERKQFNLFGFIPLIRWQTENYKTKIYLFNKILLAQYTEVRKMRMK